MNKIITIILTNIFLYLPAMAIVEDFMVEGLNPNLQIQKTKIEPITDELVSNLDKNLKIKPIQKVTINDELLKDLTVSNIPVIKAKFDFENLNSTEFKIRPIKKYSTRNLPNVGEYLVFHLSEDTTLNNKEYKKGEIVKARIETISQNGAFGVPADLTLGNFIIQNQKIDTELKITGANRSLWLYPTSYTLCAFFGLGVLLLPIRGGHAKLRPNKTYLLSL